MFQSKSTHLLWGGSDETNAMCSAFLREIRVLTEKTITRMNGFRTSMLGCFEDLVSTQITFHGDSAADAIRFVSLQHMPRQRIGIGVDRHTFHSDAA